MTLSDMLTQGVSSSVMRPGKRALPAELADQLDGDDEEDDDDFDEDDEERHRKLLQAVNNLDRQRVPRAGALAG